MATRRPFRTLFIAGFGPIVREARASQGFYRDLLGIRFRDMDGYLHTEAIEGAKAFALWPLEHAAQSCFGVAKWPKRVPVPQAWIEFDVSDVAAATKAFVARGYRPLVSIRTEPWGQVVSRLLSPEGLLVGLTFTPWMRKRAARASG